MIVHDPPSSGTLPLPPGLLRHAVTRVRALCAILFSISALYLGLTVLTQLGLLGDAAPRPVDLVWMRGVYVIAATAMLVSGALFAASYSRRIPAKRVLGFGHAFHVLGALAITTAENLRPLPGFVAGVSFVCIWIMSFSLIPATRRRAALAAFSAAAMGPAGLALGAAITHQAWPKPYLLLLLWLPNFIAAGITVFVSTLTHRLGTDVTRARRLGSYRLVEKLGEGGMGEVWRAKHRSLIRPAAVKVLRPDLLGDFTALELDGVMRRFRREVQATALLQSPHTVAIYDFGRSDDGSLYYVMELLRGIDLDNLVKLAGPQPAERVIHILGQVCHSLADAHRFGLVHRDVKPGNIHLCVLGLDVDFVKVLDFGLVKNMRGRGVELTMAGQVQGTPAYVAPEAALGAGVDARADIYGLGCVAYYLLTGALVFPGDSAMAQLSAHARTPPERPSRRTELLIPPALDELVLACLEKDPAARPTSALEVAARLAKIPVVSPWTRERAERWWRVHMPPALRVADAAEPPELDRADAILSMPARRRAAGGRP